jgi:hypothetical protein
MRERFRTERRWRIKRPLLTVEQVLDWADAHHAATGYWPSRRTGRIREAPFAVSWQAVDLALIYGYRGLPAGLSIVRLLEADRGVKPRARREKRQRSALTVEQVLGWADAHRAATGRWPSSRTGPVREAAVGEDWRAIERPAGKPR